MYGLGGHGDDRARAAGLFELAASRDRPLLEEVAKIEHGMARHALRLRGLVLRYVKALLALLTTAIAVYAGDALNSNIAAAANGAWQAWTRVSDGGVNGRGDATATESVPRTAGSREHPSATTSEQAASAMRMAGNVRRPRRLWNGRRGAPRSRNH